jgi:hypothetical protein
MYDEIRARIDPPIVAGMGSIPGEDINYGR